jgi:hypothetical protein
MVAVVGGSMANREARVIDGVHLAEVEGVVWQQLRRVTWTYDPRALVAVDADMEEQGETKPRFYGRFSSTKQTRRDKERRPVAVRLRSKREYYKRCARTLVVIVDMLLKRDYILDAR